MPGRPRISESKKELVRVRSIQGMSQTEIAEEVGLSRPTVAKIIKEMPPVSEEHNTGDNTIQYDNTKLCNKREELYLKKIQGDKALYEDIEEGWVFHLDKGNHLNKTSGLWWVGIAYPESTDKEWIRRLQMTGLEIAISPLHDKDWWDHDSPEVVDPNTGEVIEKGARYKAGDKKKAHWHFIVKSDVRISYMEINNLIRNITNGPYLQKCRSLKSAYDYFLHNTDSARHKYQGYMADEIKKYNDFHLEPNKYEIGILQAEIFKMIKENNLETFNRCIDYFIDSPEYIQLICNKPGAISSYVNSVYRTNHPDRIQKVMIVKEEEK